jgi:tetratricopeptide (TPR) repeat protein
MALQIAESLNLHLTPDEAEAIRGHLTNSSEAYDSFWKGWVLLESFHADISYPVEKISAAEAHFNRALNLDSDYSAAKAGLSLANSYYYFYGVDQTPARLAAAERLALESVENAPNLPQAHVALGMVRSVQSDHKAAVLSFRDALKLDSDDAIVWCMLAFSCNLQQPPDPIAAEEAAREAVRLDPTWMYSYQVLGLSLEMQGRYEEAVLAFESGKDLNPGYWNNYWGIGRVQLALGNHELAAEALQSALKLNESAEIHVYLGAAYAGLGEMEVALAAIEAGLEQGFDDFDAIKGSPYFASLRDDPRLEVLLKKYR